MEIKLFGKSLFSARKKTGGLVFNTAIDRIKESNYLPDFLKEIGGLSDWGELTDSVAWISNSSGAITQVGGQPAKAKRGRPKKVVPVVEAPKVTPKEVFLLKTLNDNDMKINTDAAYLDDQIATFKEKLSMIKTSEFDMNRGTIEIASIVTRLENRRQYAKHAPFYDNYPYTTTAKINDLTKVHGHLKLGEVAQFVADMPKDAIDTMRQYTDETVKLCDKKPIFYIIANKDDFKKTEKRRDPILLAQSPFGHFWQILGAWDKEMILIEEL